MGRFSNAAEWSPSLATEWNPNPNAAEWYPWGVSHYDYDVRPQTTTPYGKQLLPTNSSLSTA